MRKADSLLVSEDVIIQPAVPNTGLCLHLLALSSLSISMSQFQSTLKIIYLVNIEGYKVLLYYIFCDLRGHRFIYLNSSTARETNYSELRVDLNPLCCSGTYTQVEKLKHWSVVTSEGEGGVRGKTECRCFAPSTSRSSSDSNEQME